MDWLCAQVRYFRFLFCQAKIGVNIKGFILVCHLHVIVLFFTMITVWKNWSDWQYTEPRLCEKVCAGLLLWRKTKSQIWCVSFSGFLLIKKSHSIVTALHWASISSLVLMFLLLSSAVLTSNTKRLDYL